MISSRHLSVSAITVLALFAVPLSGQQAPSDNGGPTLEDLFTVKGVGGVQVSPDGQAVLYQVNSSDLEENETDTDIWMLRRDGTGWTEPLQLTRSDKNDTNPQWRPGSQAFAFLSSRPSDDGGNGGEASENVQQIHLLDIRGGEAQELFSHETSISSFQWSPDGSYILFRAADPEAEEDKDRKKAGRDINVEDDPGRPNHFWLLDVESGEARRVTEGDGLTVGPFDWHPDGTRVVFSATPTGRPMDSWKSDVFTISPHDSAAVPHKLTDNPGPDANPQWSPDGRHIYYTGQHTDRYQIAANHLFRISADGGDVVDVSPEADIQGGAFTFSSDGRGTFFGATTGTTRGLFYMSLDDRRPIRLTPDRGVYSSPTCRTTVA